MFNLDNAISKWREEMLAAGIKPTSLDELEEHLRSDVEQQTKADVTSAAAFANAVAQIGPAAMLRKEFTKVRRRTGAAFERWIFVIAAVFVVSTVTLLATAFSIVRLGFVEQVLGLAGLCCILGVACCWRYALPRIPVIVSRTRRFCLSSVCFVSAFLFPVALMWLAESWLGSSSALVVACIWAALPMAIFCCLAQAVLMDSDAREHWGMCRAAFGIPK